MRRLADYFAFLALAIVIVFERKPERQHMRAWFRRPQAATRRERENERFEKRIVMVFGLVAFLTFIAAGWSVLDRIDQNQQRNSPRVEAGAGAR